MNDLISRQAAIATAVRAAIDWYRLANPQYSIAYCIGEAMRALPPVQPKIKTGFNRNKGRVMVYILCNFDTTLEQDIYRIQLCRELNFSPYPMIYDKENADQIYKQLQRWCNSFIFWKAPTFEEYRKGRR